MHGFKSLKELINALAREKDLLSELFEKRKIPFKTDLAMEMLENRVERIEYLTGRGVLQQNGHLLEIDEKYLQFFEQILEVNEAVNTSFIDESIQQIRQSILDWLEENNEARRYTYLKSIKSGLRKIGRIALRSVVDLSRNIDNTFKTEPNYKIKLRRLNHYDEKRKVIVDLLHHTEELLTADEIAFFNTALDEELKQITLYLRQQIYELQHNLIEIERQIIDYLNQIRYQSSLLEKLRQVKYLKDQFELKNRTDFHRVLTENRAVLFESKPSYPLNLSLEYLQRDEARESILKVSRKQSTVARPQMKIAGEISEDYLLESEEREIFINLEEVKNRFIASGNHLFDFVLNYDFPREVQIEERITVFCKIISLYDEKLNITERYEKFKGLEYIMVFPK